MARPKKEQPNRSDGLFEIKVIVGKTIEGKPLRKSFYSSTSKEDARQRAQEYKLNQKLALLNREQFVDKTITMGVWGEKWLSIYKKNSVKNNTYSNNYEIPWRVHIKPHFGAANMMDVKPLDIVAFLDEKGKAMSLDNLSKLKICLFQIFETAIENGFCTFNPVTKNIKLKTAKTKPKKDSEQAYTKQQREYITEYGKTHKHGLPIILMLYTGIGRSELLGIKWGDVSDATVHLRRGVVEAKNPETGKTELLIGDELKNAYREREVPIPQWLYQMILDKPRTVKLDGSIRNKTPERIVETEFIFCNSLGGVQTPHNFSYYVYKPFMHDMRAHYLEQGIDIPILTAKQLRHTAATIMALDGVDLYIIAKVCGWSDLKMLSKVYGHSDVDVLREKLGY